MITETGTISAHAARDGAEKIESSVIRPLCIRGLVAILLFLKLQLQLQSPLQFTVVVTVTVTVANCHRFQ